MAAERGHWDRRKGGDGRCDVCPPLGKNRPGGAQEGERTVRDVGLAWVGGNAKHEGARRREGRESAKVHARHGPTSPPSCHGAYAWGNEHSIHTTNETSDCTGRKG